MNIHSRILALALVVLVLLLTVSTSPALAQPPAGPAAQQGENQGKSDDKEHPLGKKQRALRQKALQDKLKGKQVGKVHEVAKGQYVELAREGEDSIWTVLGEFSDLAHNQIPEPDRNVDNSTIWTADFNRDHYLDLLFSEAKGDISMRN